VVTEQKANVTPADLAVAFVEALDDEGLDRFAARLAPKLERHLQGREAHPEWMNSKNAAEYLGMSRNALYKLTAARKIPFEQEGPGCKCYFKASELDTWRRSN